MINKAFQIFLLGDIESGFVAAPTKGKAQYLAFLSAQDAGYDYAIIAFNARRAPQYDEWAKVEQRKGCFTKEYVLSRQPRQPEGADGEGE